MTAAVVNHLRFKEPVDPKLFDTGEHDVLPLMKAVEGFQGYHIVQVADDHVILIILGDDTAVLNRAATEAGSTWMTANVLPLLNSPPERHIGTVIASGAS
jgi:hypothetical protein